MNRQDAGPVGLHDREGADIDLFLGQRRTDLGESPRLVLEIGGHLWHEFHRSVLRSKR